MHIIFLAFVEFYGLTDFWEDQFDRKKIDIRLFYGEDKIKEHDYIKVIGYD